MNDLSITVGNEVRLDGNNSYYEGVRNDGTLTNVLTGLGQPGRDKRTGTFVTPPTLLTARDLECLYYNGLIRRYVDAIPEEIVKHEPSIMLGKEVDPEDTTVEDFDSYLQDNELTYTISETMRLQGLYGGAGMLILADDGLEPDQPLNLKNIKNVDFTPLSSEEIVPYDLNYGDLANPAYYQINTSKKIVDDQQSPGDFNALKIHKSRFIRFDGLYLPWRDRNNYQGWGLSRIQVIYDAFVLYESSMGGLSETLSSGDILVHSIPGLMQKVAAGQEDVLKKRLELNRMALSVYGMAVLDTDEKLVNISRSVGNMAAAGQPFVEYLQAVTGWPASILMGNSPGGLGKEGRFEERVWATLVLNWQESYCRRGITRMFRILMAAKNGPTGGNIPKNWRVKFPSTFTETETERLTNDNLIAQRDQVYVGMGAIQAVEVRGRFTKPEFDRELSIREEITEQMDAQQEAQFQTQMVGMEAQMDAILNPQPPEGEQASPEGEPTTSTPEASNPSDSVKGSILPEIGTGATKKTTKTDSFAIYSAKALKIQVTNQFPDGSRVGYVVGADNHRVDSSANAPYLILGPNVGKNYSLYRVKFNTDDGLKDGPFITGYTSMKNANNAAKMILKGVPIAGLSIISREEEDSLKGAWVY
jgi:phage-related protein (TIGR01555 family)